MKRSSVDIIQEITLKIRRDDDLTEKVAAAQTFAADLMMSTSKQASVATAVSELVTNVQRYADHGSMSLRSLQAGDRIGIEITVEDSGPGIANLDLAMSDNFSTGGSLGVGLPGAQRLMDEFEIESKVGKGTKITIRKWK